MRAMPSALGPPPSPSPPRGRPVGAARGARVETRVAAQLRANFEIVILFALQRTVSDLSIQSTASDGFAAATSLLLAAARCPWRPAT